MFWIFAGLLAGGAALFSWLRSRSTVDPWAEPWDPGEPAPHRSDFTASVGDAADALGEAAGTAVAKGRDAGRRAAEKVGETVDDLQDKVADAKDQAARRVSRRKSDAPDAGGEAAAPTEES
jgi:hypothetical protein